MSDDGGLASVPYIREVRPEKTGDESAIMEAFDIMEEKLTALREENARLRGALNDIAQWDDQWANARLEATGSYTSFDEPGSVRVARAALRATKGAGE